ncbi:hypothetical protein [Burkholderia oklahomensis]|uniref:hypothetical protein n=1 Tax=Burkholderia oklahomensis TaxID=342113 RepID=UPI00016A976D|nr:hypothetical protein [Burkholderia oklahomensis]AOI45364.1 hypothetical protein WI23_05855 [Burkholderia oklahomensis C6786]KUY58756.1 hypothetical protein WI23_17015 [Burkholderia oklahomensis C6786]MBI0358563.1 hypothetical protein [Burkholderia oklahomensis]MDN7671925.1 hypothetical protein [Burkholderia oklahomensis]
MAGLGRQAPAFTDHTIKPAFHQRRLRIRRHRREAHRFKHGHAGIEQAGVRHFIEPAILHLRQGGLVAVVQIRCHLLGTDARQRVAAIAGDLLVRAVLALAPRRLSLQE